MWKTIVLFLVINNHQLLLTLMATTPTRYIKITRPINDYFSKSGSLQLICEADGQPVTTVSWYNATTMTVLDEDNSIDLKIYKDVGLLMIHNPSDKFVYNVYCNASNKLDWTVSNVVRTGRIYLESKFRKVPRSLYLIRPLDSLMLHCLPPAGIPFPRVLWLKDKQLISEQTQSSQKMLIFSSNNGTLRTENEESFLKIMKATLSDSGMYQCLATNDYGSVESSGSWVLVSVTSDTYFNIRIDERFSSVGQDVSFECDKANDHPANWISTNEMTMNNRINASLNWLKIHDITLLDKGLYACQTNDSDPRLLNIYRLNIRLPDIIDDRTKMRKIVAVEGATVNLECDLDENQTEFYWETPNAQPIFSTDISKNRMQVSEFGDLTIENVQLFDFGKYTCNGHSSLDVIYKSLWLEVSKQPFRNYPIIEIAFQNITILQGTDINLRCKVIGDGIIDVSWFKGYNEGKQRLQGVRFSFQSNNTLKIIHPNPKEDTGFYTCEATNDQGWKVSWTALVTVVDNYQVPNDDFQLEESPLPPVIKFPKKVTSRSIDLQWFPPIDHDPRISYWIEYVKFGAISGWKIYNRNWKLTFITVDNLEPNTWYQFLVRSRNKVGVGRASVPTTYVKTRTDDKQYTNIQFSFSKINFYRPMLRNKHETILSWSLIRAGKARSQKSPVLFYVFFKKIPMLNCIWDYQLVDKSKRVLKLIPQMNSCSDKNSAKEILKYIESEQIYLNDTVSTKIPISFNEAKLSKSMDINNKKLANITWTLSNLSSFSCYNLSIIADKKSTFIHSNSQIILTPEKRPGHAPENVHVSWSSSQTHFRVSWQIPHRRLWNGILTGSIIYIKSNQSEIIMRYNNTLVTELLQGPNHELDWTIQVTITNCAGESDKSEPVVLKGFSTYSNVQSKAWIIVIILMITILICIVLCFVGLYLCCSRCCRGRGRESLRREVDALKTEEVGNSSVEAEKILPDRNDDKSSSNNGASSSQSLQIESLNSNLSLCTPYATTPLFESQASEGQMFHLTASTKSPQMLTNYYLTNVLKSGPSYCHQNPLILPIQSYDDDLRHIESSDSKIDDKDQNNLIYDTASNTRRPTTTVTRRSTVLSDQTSTSSKGKSSRNNSDGESASQYVTVDSLLRYKQPNQSVEFTKQHQYACDQSPPCIPEYTIPYTSSNH